MILGSHLNYRDFNTRASSIPAPAPLNNKASAYNGVEAFLLPEVYSNANS